jgi:hypothetical protein
VIDYSSAQQKHLPVAQELGGASLMFLVHPTLSEDEIHKTCRVVERVMALAASKVMIAGIGQHTAAASALGDREVVVGGQYHRMAG